MDLIATTRKSCLLANVLALSCGFFTFVEASPIFQVSGGGVNGYAGYGCGVVGESDSPLSVQQSLCVTNISSGNQVGTNVFAAATYTSLKAFSEFNVSVHNQGGLQPSGGALARFQDNLTILGGTGTGFLLAAVDFDGFELENGETPASVGREYRTEAYLRIASGLVVVDSLTFSERVEALIPFTFGVPLPLDITLTLFHQFLAVNSLGNHFSGLNFANSANLRPFVVFNSNMSRVEEASVTASSGFAMPVSSSQVPEPASLLLTAAGMGLTFARRLRARQNPSSGRLVEAGADEGAARLNQHFGRRPEF